MGGGSVYDACREGVRVCDAPRYFRRLRALLRCARLVCVCNRDESSVVLGSSCVGGPLRCGFVIATRNLFQRGGDSMVT